jgi:ubiquinone/menaquinone biosynthesis C-methylase UbiE
MTGSEDERTHAILEAWKERHISSTLAVMELLLTTGDAGAATQWIEERARAEPAGCYEELRHLLISHRQGCDRAVAIARRFDEANDAVDMTERVASTKNRFDESVAECEEASVALYSLGDADLLGAATDEVVRTMRGWGLLGETKDILQIGCGIGRFEIALSPHVRSAVGIDISPNMIDAARRRSIGLSNVHFDVGSGFDLAGFEDRTFDVVYAVDSMPYIVAAGAPLVETHFREAARVLKPKGEFTVFGFSYRGDFEQDRADVRRLSAQHGFDVLGDAASPFELWNGRVFRMRLGRGRRVARDEDTEV